MADQLKPGDVVILKSGSPAMTVRKVAEGSGGVMVAYCIWFEGGKQSEGGFPVETLAIYRPSIG